METGTVTGIIHSFETLGAVDGPGLRFVLFLQGCRLRCLYCHNPDTWGFESACARSVTAEEIAREVLKYRNYYGKTGGITVSGGEPLLQIGFLIALFRILKAEGIHTAIDTSGAEYDPGEGRYDELLSMTDLVLLDIKHIDNDACRRLTGRGQPRNACLCRPAVKGGHPPLGKTGPGTRVYGRGRQPPPDTGLDRYAFLRGTRRGAAVPHTRTGKIRTTGNPVQT